MNNPFISSAVFRQYLSLLAQAITLPEMANLTIGDSTKEYTLMHKIELEGYGEGAGLIEPSLRCTSWAILPVGDSVDGAEEVIDAERAWHLEGVFWVGAPKRIYRETNPVADKRWGGFSWAGNTERDLIFPQFQLVKDGPLFTTTFRLSSLDMFAVGGKPGKPSVFVGSVDENGTVVPAPVAGMRHTEDFKAPGVQIDKNHLILLDSPRKLDDQIVPQPAAAKSFISRVLGRKDEPLKNHMSTDNFERSVAEQGHA